MIRKLLAVTTAALVAGCATPGSGTSVSIPEKLGAAPEETLALETRATGVQIYECAAIKEDPSRFEWAFKGPEAELYDHAGKRIGRHYGGPTWEANDGSKVVAAVKAREDAPVAGAIPWLLLVAKSNSGAGVFGRTASIQRIATSGGAAPAGGCGKAEAGRVARVPYQATYTFYARK